MVHNSLALTEGVYQVARQVRKILKDELPITALEGARRVAVWAP
jgi:hypothetical protein